MTRTFSRRPGPFLFLLLTAAAALASPAAVALDTAREDIGTFVDSLVDRHGFKAGYVRSVLDRGEIQQSILDAISRPAERTKPWHEYRRIFVTPGRIAAGREFCLEHQDELGRVSGNTGVPAAMIAAIVGVETYYGTRTGSYRVVDALATLGFDYPPRSRFFLGELEQLFLLAREEKLDIDEMTGSYAGAMGPPQFIPSSYRNYAVDGNGDGQRDLFGNWDDILSSVANYFVRHRWAPGEPVAVPVEVGGDTEVPASRNELRLTETVGSVRRRGIDVDTSLPDSAPAQIYALEGENNLEYWVGFHNFRVITRYNRSVMYALAVHQLSEALAQSAGPAAPAASATCR